MKQKVLCCEKNSADARIVIKECDGGNKKTVSVFSAVMKSIVKDVMSPEDDMDIRLLSAGPKRFVIDTGRNVVVSVNDIPAT